MHTQIAPIDTHTLTELALNVSQDPKLAAGLLHKPAIDINGLPVGSIAELASNWMAEHGIKPQLSGTHAAAIIADDPEPEVKTDAQQRAEDFLAKREPSIRAQRAAEAMKAQAMLDRDLEIAGLPYARLGSSAAGLPGYAYPPLIPPAVTSARTLQDSVDALNKNIHVLTTAIDRLASILGAK